MKKMIKFSFIAIAAMLFFSSCSKTDSKSKTTLITTGNWKVVSDMSRTGSGAWQEEIGTYGACELDDYILFKTDNTLEVNEGATKCNPSDPQFETGIWAFTDNETKLNFNGTPAILDELTSTTLSFTTSTSFNGVSYENKVTLRH